MQYLWYNSMIFNLVIKLFIAYFYALFDWLNGEETISRWYRNIYYVFRPNKQKSKISLCRKPIPKSEYNVNYIILDKMWTFLIKFLHDQIIWAAIKLDFIYIYTSTVCHWFYHLCLCLFLLRIFWSNIWDIFDTWKKQLLLRWRATGPEKLMLIMCPPASHSHRSSYSQLHLGNIWSCDITKHGLNKDKR